MKPHLLYPPANRMAGFFVLSSILIAPCHGLQVRNFSEAAHLRMNGFPSNPSINPTFLNPSGETETRLDLTGVGWSVPDPRKQFTLVSPRHFVGANHFRPAVGSDVRFLARDGTLHTFKVATIRAIPNANASNSDLFLGEFTSELSEAVPVLPLPYLNLPTEAGYVGEPLIVVGQGARGGRGVIAAVQDFGGDPITGGSGIQTRTFTFTYPPLGGNDDAHAEVGDSGSPSFALRSGKAALVGTHTAVATALGTVTTFDTLVPHYVSELNLRMEETGLRMRKVNPAATSLSVSGAPVETTVRALAPFAFGITILNGANEAENLVADLTQNAILGIPEISADGWFSPASSTIRRGGLDAGGSSQIELAFAAAPGSGETSVSLMLKSDGTEPETFLLPLIVLPSFAEWATGLDDISPEGDSDRDGISNLLEYAFGGDNSVNSRFFPNGEEDTALLPRFAVSPHRLSYIRRTDADERGLSYIIETSTTLEAESWQVVEDAELSEISSPGPGFVEISAALPTTTAGSRFYRIRIGLNE